MRAAETDPLTEGDIPLLLEMMEEYYRTDGLDFTRPAAERAVRELLAGPEHGRIWLVRSGGAPAGYLVLTYWFSLEFHGRSAFLDELYVRPAFRRKKIATALLGMLEEFCRREGIGTLRLEVTRQNAAAIALYSNNGFRQHDRLLMTRWTTP